MRSHSNVFPPNWWVLAHRRMSSFKMHCAQANDDCWKWPEIVHFYWIASYNMRNRRILRPKAKTPNRPKMTFAPKIQKSEYIATGVLSDAIIISTALIADERQIQWIRRTARGSIRRNGKSNPRKRRQTLRSHRIKIMLSPMATWRPKKSSGICNHDNR